MRPLGPVPGGRVEPPLRRAPLAGHVVGPATHPAAQARSMDPAPWPATVTHEDPRAMDLRDPYAAAYAQSPAAAPWVRPVPPAEPPARQPAQRPAEQPVRLEPARTVATSRGADQTGLPPHAAFAPAHPPAPAHPFGQLADAPHNPPHTPLSGQTGNPAAASAPRPGSAVQYGVAPRQAPAMAVPPAPVRSVGPLHHFDPEEPRWAPDWSPDGPGDWTTGSPAHVDARPDDLVADLLRHPAAFDPAESILNDHAAGFIAPGRIAPDLHPLSPTSATSRGATQTPDPNAARADAGPRSRPGRLGGWFGHAPRLDPAPSRVAYRLNRLWLTPHVRRGVRVGLPVLVLALAIGTWLANDARQAQALQMVQDLRLAFEMRPEFRVHTLSVHSETPEVAAAMAERLDLSLPASSFHLDLDQLRLRAEGLDAVESAELRIRSGGVLELVARERVPAIIWRNHAGLELLDAQGHRIARIAQRSARADLPLIAGEGAPRAVAEARLLLAAAAPLRTRVRGLVRIGERRWDLVLDNDQRILLPAEGALAALERVLALDAAQDLLARDVTVIDMRIPARPTIRLAEPALAELDRLRRLETGG